MTTAEGAVGLVIENLGRILIEEAKFQSRVSDEVDNLKVKLSELLSFLRNAQEKQHEKKKIQVWISKSRELAYEAEDLLEEYAFKIESRERENILKRTTCFLKDCYVRRSIGLKIQKLDTDISSLTKRFAENGIISIVNQRESLINSSSSSQQQLRLTYSHTSKKDFINLDDDVEKLVGHLMNENEDGLFYGVVSIVGMGGLGKTTLARRVFNHTKIQRYFENLAWVCISQDWQNRDILREILLKFLPDEKDKIKNEWTNEELITNLFKTLINKKCLVVLDDIWSIDAWESIKDAFPMKKNGSKLLITTRKENVASHIEPNGFRHKPRYLNDLESWELLQINALGEEYHQIADEKIHEMKELGKEMAKHCGGLPLVVEVLGGVLAKKKGLEEWKSVHKNVKAHIAKEKGIDEEEGKVQNMLSLSYNDLPINLKLCFIYLGRFPEDYEIDTEMLYQLWCAEGMVSANDQIGNESMMDIAESYLKDLAERSLVQVTIYEDVVRITRFSCCRLHDLVRDMCLVKAKEENLFTLVHSRNGFHDKVYESSSSTNQIHRLVIHFEKDDVSKYMPPRKKTTRHLRSLKLTVDGDIYEGPMTRIIYSQISQFQMLRTLEIEGLSLPNHNSLELFCSGAIDFLKLSKSIGNLIHLRYLSIQGYLFLCLPSSFGNMKQLETLDIRYAHNPLIANIICKMIQLKHLYLPKLSFQTFPHHRLRLNGLSKLEILEGFESRSCCVQDLVDLINLRYLQATIDFESDESIADTLLSLLNSKSLINANLSIEIPDNDSFGMSDNRKTVFNMLFSCGKLSKLSTNIPIGKVPKYEIGLALQLVELYLKNSMFEDDPMEILGKLPKLKCMYLLWNSFMGFEMHCYSGGFLKLEELKFWGLANFENWIIEDGAMPNLTLLQIYDCKKFEMIPDGLIFLKTIRKLHVDWMTDNFNRRIQVIDGEEGEDFHKVRHVPIIEVD